MSKAMLSHMSRDELSGRLALVRVDFNVPFDADGNVTDDTRVRGALPTLRLLSEGGARVVLLSHLGRPKGKPDEPDAALSLEPVARHMRRRLDFPVDFVDECVGPLAADAIRKVDAGKALLLENTRFHGEETANDPAWSERLAHGADIFVNDAFGAAHRAHASTVGVADVVKKNGGRAVGGLLMERELRFLGGALEDPDQPFVAILGGAKISGKIDVVDALLPRVDRLLIGGAMANTFMLAMGLEVGGSLVEPDRVDVAAELMERAGEALVLPVDFVAGAEIAAGAETRVRERAAVQANETIGDIGPDTARLYGGFIREAGTVLWNGPMGVFELSEYAGGTLTVAEACASAADAGATVVLGGGDSAAAAEAAGVTKRLTHVSTGGGASLEFLAGAELPGVRALSDTDTTDIAGESNA